LQGKKQDLISAGAVWRTTAGNRVAAAWPPRSAAPTAPHRPGRVPGRLREERDFRWCPSVYVMGIIERGEQIVDTRSPSVPANGTKPPSDIAGRPESTTHKPYPCRSGRSVPYPGWNFPPPTPAPPVRKRRGRLRGQNTRFRTSRTLSSRTNDTTPAFSRDWNHF